MSGLRRFMGPTPGGVSFPNWRDTSNNWTQFIAAYNQLNTGQSNVLSTFGSLGAGLKWRGSALSSYDLCIYGAPYADLDLLKIDPTTDTATRITWGGGVANKFAGIVNSSYDDCLYCIPLGSTFVLKYNPATGAFTNIGALGAGQKWYGGCEAYNQMIYGAPYADTQVLKINPIAGTATRVGSVLSAAATKWRGFAPASNGKLYAGSYDYDQILELDPATDTTRIIPLGFSPVNSFERLSVGLDGNIYMCANDSLSIEKLNVTTDAVSSFGNVATTVKWAQVILAPTKKLILVPNNYNAVGEVDTVNSTLGSFGSVALGGSKWFTGTLAPNGAIYCPPLAETTVLKILSTVSPNLNSNYVLSRFVNRN